MTDRSPVPASEIYNVDRWGDSYFRIDDQGQLCVRPNGEQGGQATLEAVLENCRAAGLRAPVLARFSGILRQRVKLLPGPSVRPSRPISTRAAIRRCTRSR